jgi:hypothetical protein
MDHTPLRSVKKADISLATLTCGAVKGGNAASLRQALSRKLMVVVEDSSLKDINAIFQAMDRSSRASLSGRAPSAVKLASLTSIDAISRIGRRSAPHVQARVSERNLEMLAAQAGCEIQIMLGSLFRILDMPNPVSNVADALRYNRPSFCSRSFISAMRCSPA